MKRLLAGVVCAAVLAIAVAPASAAIRYAVPGGNGGDPCNPNPCGLPTAINKASDGDQVIVGAGTYKPTGAVDVNHAIDVGGVPGARLSVVQLRPGSYFEVENQAATVHDMSFERVGEAMERTLEIAAGTVERVYSSEGEESGGACLIVGGVLRDSVCRGFTEIGASGAGNFPVVLRNDTFGASLVGADEGANLSVDAANVIMHSEEPLQPDLSLDVNVGSTGSLVATNSSYATVSTSLSAGTGYSFTPPGTVGNQTTPPQFVAAGAGEYAELPSSPTVDAGLTDPLIGAADLTGAPRSQPACIGGTPIPDIGAYELTPTVPCPASGEPSPPPATKPSNQFSFGKLDHNLHSGTARLIVTVPNPGTLTLAGAGVERSKVSLQAGRFALLVRAKRKWKRSLLLARHVVLSAKVTFTPTGGEPNTETRTVNLIKRGRG